MAWLGLVPVLPPQTWLERSGEPQSSLTANKKSNRRAREAFRNKCGGFSRERPASEGEDRAGGNGSNAGSGKALPICAIAPQRRAIRARILDLSTCPTIVRRTIVGRIANFGCGARGLGASVVILQPFVKYDRFRS